MAPPNKTIVQVPKVNPYLPSPPPTSSLPQIGKNVVDSNAFRPGTWSTPPKVAVTPASKGFQFAQGSAQELKLVLKEAGPALKEVSFWSKISGVGKVLPLLGPFLHGLGATDREKELRQRIADPTKLELFMTWMGFRSTRFENPSVDPNFAPVEAPASEGQPQFIESPGAKGPDEMTTPQAEQIEPILDPGAGTPMSMPPPVSSSQRLRLMSGGGITYPAALDLGIIQAIHTRLARPKIVVEERGMVQSPEERIAQAIRNAQKDTYSAEGLAWLNIEGAPFSSTSTRVDYMLAIRPSGVFNTMDFRFNTANLLDATTLAKALAAFILQTPGTRLDPQSSDAVTVIETENGAYEYSIHVNPSEVGGEPQVFNQLPSLNRGSSSSSTQYNQYNQAAYNVDISFRSRSHLHSLDRSPGLVRFISENRIVLVRTADPFLP